MMDSLTLPKGCVYCIKDASQLTCCFITPPYIPKSAPSLPFENNLDALSPDISRTFPTLRYALTALLKPSGGTLMLMQ